jgi:prephenate dehydratase
MTTSIPGRAEPLTPSHAAHTSRAATRRVAFQGEPGAYGDEAIARHWGGAAVATPVWSFDDVVDAVSTGATERGVLPCWNSVVGAVHGGCDALERARELGLAIVAEIEVPVHHQLLANPGTSLDEIIVVASHPVALAQCRRFLAAHPLIMPCPVYDTAGAARDLARDLARDRTHGHAAIASRSAGERYGLVVLAADIQDVAHNVTRFAVIARDTRGGARGRW